MEKPWWLKKSAPAEEANNSPYDLDNIYYGKNNKNEDVTEPENSYLTYEDGDVNDVGVSISYEPIKEVAKAEPIFKKTFTPKDATDSQAVVDALKEDRVIVLYMEELISSKETFRRFFDYVMGAVQALDAEYRKPDRDTAVLLPYVVAKDADEDFNVSEYVDSLEEAAAEEIAD